MKPLFAFIALMLFTLPLQAHEIAAGSLEIIHPSIPATPPHPMTAAGYMAISNSGAEADRLIGIETPIAAQATLHATQVDAGGYARMVPLDGLDIPAGDTVVLEPGATHVMFMGLDHALKEEDSVPATLVFQHAGRVEITFAVTPPDGAMDHSAHGGGSQGQAGN